MTWILRFIEYPRMVPSDKISHIASFWVKISMVLGLSKKIQCYGIWISWFSPKWMKFSWFSLKWVAVFLNFLIFFEMGWSFLEKIPCFGLWISGWWSRKSRKQFMYLIAHNFLDHFCLIMIFHQANILPNLEEEISGTILRSSISCDFYQLCLVGFLWTTICSSS